MAEVFWNGDFWESSCEKKLFDWSVTVFAVTVGRDRPTTRQLDLIDEIENLPESCLNSILALAENYRSIVTDASDQTSQIIDEFIIRRVLIPEIGDCQEQYFVLTGNCSWEEEHGIQFVIENSNVLHCGPNTGIAMSYTWEDIVELPVEERPEAVLKLLPSY